MDDRRATFTATPRVSLPADTFPFGVAVNPVTNHVYLTSFTGSLPGLVTVLNEVTGSVTTIAVPVGVFLVAANPTTNRIYVTNNVLGSGKVTVIDGATNTLMGSPIPVGSGPWIAAVNPVTNRIYVANNGSNSVSVIPGATNLVIATVPLPSGGAPRGVAVNPMTNRIYVAVPPAPPFQTGASIFASGLIAVIDGETNTLLEAIPSSSVPLDVAVNPSTNRVYVTMSGDQEVEVIDGETNTILGGVSNGETTQSVAVNPTTSRVYIGRGFGTGGVAVIAECPFDTQGNFLCPP